MKTWTILVAGLATTAVTQVTAQDLRSVALQRAEQAHAAAAELSAMTLPHAHCSPAWNHVSRGAVAADAEAEAVLAALSACDFCAAYECAEKLNDIADHLQDDVEDLDPVVGPFPGRLGRQETRRVERMANILEDIARDLRRDTRRLDESQERFVGGPGYPAVVPIAPPITTYPVMPGHSPRIYGTPSYTTPTPSYGTSPSYGGGNRPGQGTLPGYGTTPGYSVPPGYGAGATFDGSLGPGLTTPPADSFGPTPAVGPLERVPSTNESYYHGVTPSAGIESPNLPPGLSKKSKVPPGHLKKIPQRENHGPALLAPSAEHETGFSTR